MRPTLPPRQRGATLIEVMISALIVAFGMLAMIALQSNAIKYTKTSEYRSVATLLANDLADRMRVNAEDGAMAGRYDLLTAYEKPTTVPARTECAAPTNCTPTDLATRDLGEWRRALYFSLPGGNGFVQSDPTNRAVNIWVAWQDPDETARPVGDNGAVKECPAAFLPTAGTATPRCMYFRIGMAPPPPPSLP
ncbi:MAG: type IV pilus modification protein PilV [Aquabacterium sp.]|uniref:type IV pilus modification protein PilV n=1 Tax=Aquabacterium sp. TaxID=1872578 RepID=UPI0027241CCE|nr:type IV pilus modification protein PilV [Aquabacterium sp.]MDO9003305.1 type IV pilus modification protein PilV [Aquabacterium sp.]